MYNSLIKHDILDFNAFAVDRNAVQRAIHFNVLSMSADKALIGNIFLCKAQSIRFLFNLCLKIPLSDH